MSDSFAAPFKFIGHQKQAVTSRNQAIAVTAGAGSGKTRVLVGRYVHLLDKGYALRLLAAITFTDKAAREMRMRIRTALEERQAATGDGELLAQLDAARIGTIHSLCAEILRAHPAEAALDPNFAVLEEGRAAALQAQSVENTLAWAAAQPDLAPLFAALRENGLRTTLTTLINRRLDLISLPAAVDWAAALAHRLDAPLHSPDWLAALAALNQVHAHKPDDKLEQARNAVLRHWQAVRVARQSGNWDALFASLVQLRSAIDVRSGQKANWSEGDLTTARDAMRTLRDTCDAELAALIDKDKPVSWACDRQAAALQPALRQALTHALDEYQQLKDEMPALDFDDLEGRAAQLLQANDDVRARWQTELRAVLVDEFQDTNARQRDIVYALTGFRNPHEMSLRGAHPEWSAAESKEAPQAGTTQRGDLFIVGDAKQSIYRFRGADVTVFRQVQANIAAAKGLSVNLDLTFRAHRALLDTTNALLAPILGETNDPAHPYQVPFAPLSAHRPAPESPAVREPFVEFHLGLGEDASAGRQAAAAALVERLQRLHDAEGVAWNDVALLFRSSTHFDVYEEALERGGIPFVTVAGRGFYDRPEIRDVLNALVAIADPTDDLALAGLLRSPAIGLSDVELYRLRIGHDQRPRSIWKTIKTSEVLRGGAGEDLGGLTRAYNIISELHDLAGRVSAAEVIKRFFDLTGYRALLSAAPGGARLRRNVDKLLADAHRSRLVNLSEFLEYVQTLRDIGAREGEAPVEAEGALQLMTVHKAKGLEFPVVVIADAAYEHRSSGDAVLLDDELGLLIDLVGDDDARPAMWQLARLTETAKADAEDKRLLYVALTRAKDKLIVSGHVKLTKSRLSLRGWLALLGSVIGLDTVDVAGEVDRTRELNLQPPIDLPHSLGCVLYPPHEVTAAVQANVQATPLDRAPVAAPELIAPISIPNQKSEIENQPSKVWRVVPRAKRPSGPAWVVGKLTHEALRRWRFPSEDNFDEFLLPFALELGLTDHAEIQATIDEVRRLLTRFQAHPLCREIAEAERYHEIPYALPGDTGVIDLLYHAGPDWTIVDFKTDELRSLDEARETIGREGYDVQLRRYVEAIEAQLGQRPRARLVFLQVRNEVRVVEY